MSFKSAVLNTPVQARTQNGMKALASTLSNTTDLFFKIGASRGKDITTQFAKAYAEDREMALRVSQWARDVRGGAGERDGVGHRVVARNRGDGRGGGLGRRGLVGHRAPIGAEADLVHGRIGVQDEAIKQQG